MSSESISSPQETFLPRSKTIALPWERVALAAIAVLAAVLNFIQLDRIGLGNTYYAAAVKSMATTWHAFFFASLDPGGFVAIDKPPLAFWIQAASVKLFGFSGISLLLPEAMAGLLSVLLLYYLVARVFGRLAGLLAALALALTPVAVLVNRSNLVESILVLTVLLAAWAVTRATETGRLRWLLLGAVLVGLGFNIKMLEAYLVLPALILMYLLGAPVRWRTRVWHLILAAIVLLTVSLSWVMVVDLTPASQRPYVGSSGDNSELSLALGYNGLGRLTGNVFSFLNGGTTLGRTISDLSPSNLGFTQGETGSAGVQRLVNAQLGGQTGWLLALAVIGLIVVAWQSRVRFPLNRQQQALVLWGIWLLTGGAFFSVAGFFHAYYLAMIAPPVAALAGIAIVTLWQDYRRPGWRGWALPLALVVTAGVQAHILSYFPTWSNWLTPLVVGSTVLIAIALVAVRLMQRRSATSTSVYRRAGLAAVALSALALLLSPSIWSEYTVATAAGNMVPSAGPAGRGGFGGAPPRFAGARGFPSFPGSALRAERGRFPFGGPGFGGRFRPPPGGFGRGDDTASANPNLVRYLESHQGKTKFLVATLNASQAEPFILATDKPVMDLGGFMGADRILTPQQLAADVKNGTIRYFLLNGGGQDRRLSLPNQLRSYLQKHDIPIRFRGGFGSGFRGGFGGGNGNNDLVQWVAKNCSVVPASAYHMATASSVSGFGPGGGGQQLYDCGG